jgi:hypothetical protein
MLRGSDGRDNRGIGEIDGTQPLESSIFEFTINDNAGANGLYLLELQGWVTGRACRSGSYLR